MKEFTSLNTDYESQSLVSDLCLNRNQFINAPVR